MDDFYILGNSFDWWLNNLAEVIKRCKDCNLVHLNNLAEVLKRCEDCNLVLNWEKCHFMVK